MRVLQLPDLFLLQIDFGHLPVIVSELFIIIIVGWLLVLLQLINRFLVALLCITVVLTGIFAPIGFLASGLRRIGRQLSNGLVTDLRLGLLELHHLLWCLNTDFWDHRSYRWGSHLHCSLVVNRLLLTGLTNRHMV